MRHGHLQSCVPLRFACGDPAHLSDLVGQPPWGQRIAEKYKQSGVILTPMDELKEKYSIFTFSYLMELIAITYAELRTIKIKNDKE